MGLEWTATGTAVVTAFIASLVEFVEALTVVLAVGSVRGWSGALAGTGLALVTLAALVALLGQTLTQVPIDILQTVIGLLLLLFGLRWLRKAVLRSAGVIPLHDETALYAEEHAMLRGRGIARGRWDGVAIHAAFQIVMIEGIEVVFIVIAVGANGHLRPAALGAFAALLLVVLLGIALHRPLASLPENAMKFTVGALLSAFGTFLVGEGLGAAWPGADWSLPVLILCFVGAALLCVRLAKAAFRGDRRAWP